MDIQFSENLSGIEQMLIVKNSRLKKETHLVSPGRTSETLEKLDLLLCVESQEGQVQQQRQPVSIDQKEERQECVNGSFGDDVGVESVAEIDRVDIVTVLYLC